MTKKSLLTHEEKLSAILQIQKKFHRKGELFLPDNEIYPTTFTEANLESASKKVFVWLGIKPTNIAFRIINNTDQVPSLSQKNIVISAEIASNPFLAYANICKQVLSICLLRNGIEPDDELLELASLELGLGLIFINTIGSGDSLLDRINRTFNINSKNPASSLAYYQAKQYATLFNDFIKSNDLHATAIREHTVPWATHYLTNVSLESSKLSPEPFVNEQKRRIATARTHVAQISIVLILIVGIIVFLLIHNPKRLTIQLENQKTRIEVLELSYSACMNSLKQKQHSYDTNDFFMIRQLDAHLSRCTSIGNQHDFEVKDFNQKLKEAGLE